jgi:hypothetical protein
MMIEVVDVSVQGVPLETLDFLRSYAKRQGHSRGNAGVLRFAAVELERRLRKEASDEKHARTARYTTPGGGNQF